MNFKHVILFAILWFSTFLCAQDANFPSLPAVQYSVQENFDTIALPTLQWIIEEGETPLSIEDLTQNQLKDAKVLDLKADPIFKIEAHRNYWTRIQMNSKVALSPSLLRLDRLGDCFPWEFTFKMINVYTLEGSNWVQSGRSGTIYSTSERDVSNKIFPSLLNVDLAEKPIDLWIQLSMAESCDIEVDLGLVTTSYAQQPKAWSMRNITHNLLYGAIILLLVLSLFFYFWSREVIYIWFIIYLLFILSAGIIHEYRNWTFKAFFSEHPRFMVILRTFLDLGRFLGVIQFARIYIDTKSKFPIVHKILGGSIIALSFLTVVGVLMRIFPSLLANAWFFIRPLVAFLGIASALGCLIYLLFSKDKLARFFCIGAIVPYAAVLVSLLLINSGENSEEVDSSLYNGIGMVFALTLALAYRFRLLTMRRWQLHSQLQVEQQEGKRLKELDTFKSRLYTNITHEFRTPLTVILGMADQLKDASKERAAQSIRLIESNGRQLLDLINQLLDLSKLENKSFQLQYQQGDIVPYLRYLTESFQTFTNSKNILLRFHSNLESLVMDYDAKQIQQIWRNLISNAVKFTPSGGTISIKLSLNKEITNNKISEKDDSTQQLIIAIKDTGIGISEKDLPNIFDRFFQADNDQTKQGEGTGIGLAHCKELVKLMGGEISVQSVVEEGTTFTILLPITNQAMVGEFKIEQNGLAPIRSFSESEKKKVRANGQKNKEDLPHLLIIEDNADVVIYLQNCLEDHYQLDIAYNGRIGIEKALENIPDLIVSDVMMPEKNGYEVCDTLKNDELTSHIPIILLTAKSDTESKIEGLKTGADAYLGKPFNREELLVRLEKLMELRKKLRARYAQIAEVPAPITTAAPIDIEDAFIQKARTIVNEQINNPDFNPIRLCRSLGMSQSQLYRKMKALTDSTPALFIRSIRLQKGMELLKTTDMTVSEIAYDVGFSDPSYFSRTFSEKFGSSPNENRK